MEKVLKKLNIKEIPFAKTPKKQKVFNKVKLNAPPIANFNYEADILYLPTTKEKYKYLLVVCDIANNKFDIEPMKTKTSTANLEAFKNIIKRKILTLL